MHIQQVLLCCLAVILARVLFGFYQSIASPLRSVPGPLFARLTKAWYFRRIWLGHFEDDNIALHRKYGPVVRIAPDHYSIDDPMAVKTIYGIGSKFPKSDWYQGWKHPDPNRWTIFPEQDMKRHAETRKLFQGMYSMSSLVNYEEYVDECAQILSNRLTQSAHSGEAINMGHWFRCYAFDVIGNITYSRRFGFLDRGEDVDNAMASLDKSMVYSTLIGVYAKWHAPLFDLLARFNWTGAGGRVYVMRLVNALVARRKLEKSKNETAQIEDMLGKPQDFLEKMMRANEKDPEKVTDYHVFMMGLSNIIAGSDTTATSLSSILYHLCRYPSTMKKLREEVDQFRAEGRCGNPNVTFKESQEMPYLQAVMKEALRLHSATGLPLWRVVPEGGCETSGQFFPSGTVVGINTWCAHFNKDVFGEDAAEFRPERWIKGEKEGRGNLKEMDAYYMPFGLGSRTCLGRHISTLEMSKLIPQLVTRFEFELKRPNMAWKTENYWFVMPTDFDVKVKVRGAAEGYYPS